MTSASPGIGRGLAAILPQSEQTGDELREIPVELIRPNPDQPRRRFDEVSLQGLAESIAAAGVVQPLLVTPLAGGTYELVAGERRWRAAKLAGLATVPAVVREDSELRRLEAALVENMVRDDLNPVEEARATAALVEELGVAKEEVARRIGRSRSAVSNLIRLLDLPDEVLELLESGKLSGGHGRAILQAKDNDARRRLGKAAAREGWSVRETEGRARGGKVRTRKTAGKLALHPDQEALRTEAEEALGELFGAEAKVRLTGRGAVAELRFADLAALADSARRASRRAA